MGEYPNKVDIKRLLTFTTTWGKQEATVTGQDQAALSLSEVRDAGLGNDRDGDMISDRKL